MLAPKKPVVSQFQMFEARLWGHPTSQSLGNATLVSNTVAHTGVAS